MQSRLLLNVVVLEGSAVLELLNREDEPLLIMRDALLVLQLGLDGLNGIGALDLQGNGVASHEFVLVTPRLDLVPLARVAEVMRKPIPLDIAWRS